jgi:hypothetical protein
VVSQSRAQLNNPRSVTEAVPTPVSLTPHDTNRMIFPPPAYRIILPASVGHLAPISIGPHSRITDFQEGSMSQSARICFVAVSVFALVACSFSQSQFQRRVCYGDYAFCSASTCTPNGNLIKVHTATGYAYFPSATCKCPILTGLDEVEVEGGNMLGSCAPPSASTVWSGFWPHAKTPQALANWQDVEAPGLICGKELNLANQSVNCYSFLCQRAGSIKRRARRQLRLSSRRKLRRNAHRGQHRLLHSSRTMQCQLLFERSG